jgi:hypothetical protein
VTLHIRTWGPHSWTKKMADYMASMMPKDATFLRFTHMSDAGNVQGKVMHQSHVHLHTPSVITSSSRSWSCRTDRGSRRSAAIQHRRSARGSDAARQGVQGSHDRGRRYRCHAARRHHEGNRLQPVRVAHLAIAITVCSIGWTLNSSDTCSCSVRLSVCPVCRWKYAVGESFPNRAYFYWMCAYNDLDSFRWFFRCIKECHGKLLVCFPRL